VLSFAVPGVEGADKTVFASHFFRGALAQLRIHLSLVARFEPAEKTVIASRNVSALLSFAPHSIGSPVKGSRQLCCRGVEKTIRYQLSALRCGQRSLVGNGFIRSVVMVLPVVPGRADAKTVSASALMRN
jgi:hypothetical protein